MSDRPSTSKSTQENVNTEAVDLFFFESDHLALKGNKDYSELLKSIAILEAQKARAIMDIDRIIDVQKHALEDPERILLKLKNKEDLGVPGLQNIAEIPNINWSKYNIDIPDESFKLLSNDKNLESKQNDVFKMPKKRKLEDNHSTFKQPWTSEEQKKLEELLIQFPPEAIEMRRYKKIAEGLGNRTVKQVTSRVQKYFAKLHRAGLPIPGRIPKTLDKKRVFVHKHQRHNSYLYKPTTFFPDMEVPVHMSENDDDDLIGPNIPPPDITQNANNTNNEVKSDIQLKMEFLQRIKAEKEKEQYISTYVHKGFQCDLCKETPILGCRWHCNTCDQESIDFCNDCIISQLLSINCHPLSHNLIPVHNFNSSNMAATQQTNSQSSNSTNVKSEPISEEESSSSSDSDESMNTENELLKGETDENDVYHDYDKDYVSHTYAKELAEYNYLDPNFLPN